MPPYEIHEAPIRHFARQIQEALWIHGLHKDEQIACEVNLNTAIRKGSTVVVPDFGLELRPLHKVALEPIPFWVGECGFSSTRSHMEYQLKAVLDVIPEIDALFMISVREEKRDLPPIHHPLHAARELSRSAFSPSTTPDKYFQPVVVEGITWIEVKSVTINLFLRGSNGEFNFKKRGEAYAVGVSGTIIFIHSSSTVANTSFLRLCIRTSTWSLSIVRST